MHIHYVVFNLGHTYIMFVFSKAQGPLITVSFSNWKQQFFSAQPRKQLFADNLLSDVEQPRGVPWLNESH